MKALVDTNILLDVVLQRAALLADSDGVVRWCQLNAGHGFIAWHSVSNVYFLTERDLGDVVARQFIASMVGIFEVVATGTAHVRHALALPMGDFEDALQAAAAVQAGVDYIVTRDVGDFRSSPVPAILPADFLALV